MVRENIALPLDEMAALGTLGVKNASLLSTM
jgi:hypothetical protein